MRFLVIFLLVLSLTASAQYFPERGFVFDDTEVPTVEITINPVYLDSILMPGYETSTREYPATFSLNHSGTTESVTNIGFRLRGNTSRYSLKKSFKISFNAFEDKKFHGLEKMNLNGEHNDPTVCRSTLFWNIAAASGIPGSRINHINLYINGQYKGVYANIEQIDEEFAELRFGNKDGNLYKCTYPADLNYISASPNSYKLETNGVRVYELQTNEETDDYADLARLIHVLAFYSGNSLREQLEPIFNVRSFLKYYAFEVLMGHWDGYAVNRNNFYLYHNTATGQFEFIPYDGDNTFGIDWFNVDWAKRDINNWAESGRPLVNKLLLVKEYKEIFNFYMHEMLVKSFNAEQLNPMLLELEDKLAPFIAEDSYYPLDYGYDLADFHYSFDSPVGNHVKYGLKGYISTRYTYSNSQRQNTSTAPIINQVRANSPVSGQLACVSAVIEDEEDKLFPWIHYQKTGGSWDSIPMYNDGLHADGLPSDSLYAGFIQTKSFEGSILYYISVTDATGKTAISPFAETYSLQVRKPATAVYINEVMADNEQDTIDEVYVHEDWIEIYNGSDRSISGAHLYLSDDDQNLLQWQLPAVRIEQFSYSLFWADNDPEEGPTHTSFKLSDRGETLYLSYFDGDSSSMLDVFPFAFLAADQTAGRYPNGIGPVQILKASTPEASNIPAGQLPGASLSEALSLYPNPFADYLTVNLNNPTGELFVIQIYTTSGQLIDELATRSSEWIWDGKGKSGEALPAGLFLVRAHSESGSWYEGKALKINMK